MKEVIDDIDRWLGDGETTVALVTVVRTWGSAPRGVGAKMAFTAGGAAVSGSVSGGCVEGAVIEAGSETLATGRPQLLHFGVADETAWSVGLACGGTIDVFVEPLDRVMLVVARRWNRDGRAGALLTVIRGPADLVGRKVAVENGAIVAGSFGPAFDDAAVAVVAAARQSGLAQLAEGVEVFVDWLRPAPSLVIVGGAHIAVALARLAKVLGYRTVVIDPRRAFGSAARFPDVDQLIQAWPDKALAEHPLRAESAVVTLSHDPKIDDPALRAALSSDAFYIGALGSRKTHAARVERLAAWGFTPDQLARIHAPVGLDIGAQEPEEIALAVMAEIVTAWRAGKKSEVRSEK